MIAVADAELLNKAVEPGRGGLEHCELTLSATHSNRFDVVSRAIAPSIGVRPSIVRLK